MNKRVFSFFKSNYSAAKPLDRLTAMSEVEWAQRHKEKTVIDSIMDKLSGFLINFNHFKDIKEPDRWHSQEDKDGTKS